MGTVDVLVGASLVALLSALVAMEGSATLVALSHAMHHYVHLVGGVDGE
jgi:hypothetical protein